MGIIQAYMISWTNLDVIFELPSYIYMTLHLLGLSSTDLEPPPPPPPLPNLRNECVALHTHIAPPPHPILCTSVARPIRPSPHLSVVRPVHPSSRQPPQSVYNHISQSHCLSIPHPVSTSSLSIHHKNSPSNLLSLCP